MPPQHNTQVIPPLESQPLAWRPLDQRQRIVVVYSLFCLLRSLLRQCRAMGGYLSAKACLRRGCLIHDICHSFCVLYSLYFASFLSSECSISFAPFPQILFFAKTKHVLKLPPQPSRQSFLPPSMVWCEGLFGVNPAWWTRMRTDHQRQPTQLDFASKKKENCSGKWVLHEKIPLDGAKVSQRRKAGRPTLANSISKCNRRPSS